MASASALFAAKRCVLGFHIARVIATCLGTAGPPTSAIAAIAALNRTADMMTPVGFVLSRRSPQNVTVRHQDPRRATIVRLAEGAHDDVPSRRTRARACVRVRHLILSAAH